MAARQVDSKKAAMALRVDTEMAARDKLARKLRGTSGKADRTVIDASTVRGDHLDQRRRWN